MTNDLGAEKRELRARLRALRDAIPPEQRSALGAVVQRRLAALPAFRAARTLLLFYAFGSELPTSGVIEQAIQDGRRVFLPRFEGDQLEFAPFEPGDVLVPTTYGPKEPTGRPPVDPKEVDVVVAPGLGFDRLGYRLGYGGGHYDRYLRRLPASTPRVGIAFGIQVIAHVPHGPRDERVDAIVTEAETIVCPQRDGSDRETSPTRSQEPGP